MSTQTISVLNTLVGIAISLSVLLVPAGIVGGIILAIQASSEQDKAKKTKKVYWTIASFLAPFVLLFVILSIWGLFRVLTGTFAG